MDRQQRAIEEGIVNPESLDAAAAAEVLQWECPVQWVRVDPEGEWLADVRLPVSQVGLEGMITAQLTKERPADVASQIAAISHLEKRAEAGSTSAVNALLQCAEDPNTFCRVRADAARSLGKCARDATQRSNLAATSVQRAYRRRRCDPATGLPAPTTLTNLAESIVDEGFVHALGAPRVPGVGGARWTTPVECVELLADALDHHDADGDPHDGSSLVAAALTALGSTRPPTVASVVGAARAIRRWLWHDAAVCGVGGATHAGGRRVTVAALHALARLTEQLPPLQDVLAKAAAAKRGAESGVVSDGADLGAGLGADLGAERDARPADDAASAARVVSDCVTLARRAVSDAAGDGCQAVRRAGAAWRSPSIDDTADPRARRVASRP